MEPEAAAAIKIADKHLAGKSPERRSELAKDIVQAIINHAGLIAEEEIKNACASLTPRKN